MKIVSVALLALIFGVVGIVCLVWPHKVQELYRSAEATNERLTTKPPRLARPIVCWFQRRFSLFEIRFVGLIALVCSILILHAWYLLMTTSPR